MFLIVPFLLLSARAQRVSLATETGEELPNICVDLYETISCFHDSEKRHLTIKGFGSFSAQLDVLESVLYVYLNGTESGLVIEANTFVGDFNNIIISGPVQVKSDAFTNEDEIYNLDLYGDEIILEESWIHSLGLD